MERAVQLTAAARTEQSAVLVSEWVRERGTVR